MWHLDASPSELYSLGIQPILNLSAGLALRMALDICDEALAGDESIKSDNQEGREECCICLMAVTLSAMGTLECGHNQFHYKCIADWGALSPSCPICKAKFSSVLQNGRKFRLKKLKPTKEMQLPVEDDNEESDYEEEDDLENCAICSIQCVDGDGSSVFCDCGESVHLFCIGRRIGDDSKGNVQLWTCVECTRVGRISGGSNSSSFSFSSEGGISSHDSSSPRMARHSLNTSNRSRNRRGILAFIVILLS